jgi:hypothetical protein
LLLLALSRTWCFSGSTTFFESAVVCRRIGGIDEVIRVGYGYWDTCYGGLKDPSQHWFLKIWDNVKTWPKKDLLHGFYDNY